MTRLGRALWATVAAVAAVGLVLSLVALLRPSAPPDPVVEVRGPAAVDPTRSTPGGSPPDTSTPGRSPASVQARDDVSTSGPASPALVRVPGIDLTAPVDATGVGRDQQMRLPRDPRRLGWYRFGPAPGQEGSAVLAGHVDSAAYGVGPLSRLGELAPGDLVEVRLDGGRWRGFRVDSVQRFERTALPAEVFSRSGPPRVRLITCTGPYLPEAGGYQENLVVTAVPA